MSATQRPAPILFCLCFVFSGCAALTSDPSAPMVIAGSASAGPAVAEAVRAAGITDVTTRFSTSTAGVAAFCGQTIESDTTVDMVVLTRPLRPTEGDACRQDWVTYETRDFGADILLIRKKSLDSVVGLRSFANNLTA